MAQWGTLQRCKKKLHMLQHISIYANWIEQWLLALNYGGGQETLLSQKLKWSRKMPRAIENVSHYPFGVALAEKRISKLHKTNPTKKCAASLPYPQQNPVTRFLTSPLRTIHSGEKKTSLNPNKRCPNHLYHTIPASSKPLLWTGRRGL